MKFRFPVVIIDEDFRSENASGLGIRALAKAIEGEGVEVLGVTGYSDLSQFAQQQSRASAFIPAGTESSRSRMTPSAPLATAFAGHVSRCPGTKSRERMSFIAILRKVHITHYTQCIICVNCR